MQSYCFSLFRVNVVGLGFSQEDNIFRVSESRLLRRIFGIKKEKITENYIYSLQEVVTFSKQKK